MTITNKTALQWFTASALLLLTIFPMQAQKKSFTLDELIPGGKDYPKLTPKAAITATWWGNELVWKKANALSKRNKKGEWKEFLSLSTMNETLKAAGLNEARSLGSVTFPYADKPILCYTTAAGRVLYDWEANTVVWKQTLPKGISHEEWMPASRASVYNLNNNLYIMTADGKQLQLSTDGSADIVYGQSVHRNEFGIHKGTFWSPDGQRLCFYRMDQSMVPDYPLVNLYARIAEPAPTRYPMAGEASHKVTVGVYDVKTNKTTWLQTGDPTDQYYAGIQWTPDGKHIILYNLNRDQNHARMLMFDAETGREEAMLYEERHEKYVNLDHDIAFLPWDSDKMIYWSQKDDLDALYLYSISQRQTLKRITGPELGVVLQLVGFCPKTKSVIVQANGVHPMRHNHYAVNIEKGKATLLDNGRGVHRASLSADGTQMTDTWSDPTTPLAMEVTNTVNAKTSNLYTAADPWADYNVPEITTGTFKAADGRTDLYYRLLKPVGFDPSRQYPTVVYVYGGPHTRLVDDSFHSGSRGWEIYMAQLGYVVFVMDNRGSSERGRDFENATFRKLGTVEMEDQMCGIRMLKSLPYVDAQRIGVHGWSFGGFMTTNMMLTHGDVYKCGVAGGPVIDWSLYEVMYGERYMDTPQSNPEGYKKNNLTLRAGDLKGRLLVIYGHEDPVCVPQHTLSFIDACIKAGTHPDLFTYPGHGHNMVGAARVHLHEKITQYFEEHLK